MYGFKRHIKRSFSLLDGIWDFNFWGDINADHLTPPGMVYHDRMPVPSAFDAYPSYAGKRGIAIYRTFFHVQSGKKSLLVFRGTGMWTRILVDGQILKTVSLPYSRIEIEVPPAGREERELAVICDNRFDFSRIPLQENFYDFYAYGGIFRSVELHILPEISFRRVKLFPQDVKSGEIKGEIFFRGMDQGCMEIKISTDGKNPEKKQLAISGGRAEISFLVPDARPWSALQPALHTITVESADDDIRERIGFRTIGVQDGRITLNGEKIKLLGYCRHETHPQFGPAVSAAQHVQDIEIIKSLGCNFIRGSHYPQDPVFLDLCDEMGIYVFEESMGWGNREKHFTDPAFYRAQILQTELMLEKSINHPSVIMWGFLNEGASDQEYARPLYRDLYALVHREDKSRPVTHASMFGLTDICYEYADIISINTYPGWYAENNDNPRPLDEINSRIDRLIAHLEKAGCGKKPFLLSEIGAGAIYGFRDPLAAHWSEQYQADYLETVCRRVITEERLSGVSLWQFCDGRTYATSRALGRPRGFNNKGTFDEYRRPKTSAAKIREIFCSGILKPENIL
ncbi:MAG: hypothetical protein A2096_17360 [Spirochaetes bacterium GWF1_41_5]|nr:MAG: hypothetical protein A2096_17360 [Spirochaetes bacterium GWF1_41_5]